MTTRNLQITIIESAGAPRGRRAGRPGAPGFDPEGYPVMPPPEDPEGYPVMPPPEDPEGYPVMPPPEDPEGYPVMPPPEDPEGYPVMPPPEDPRGGFPGAAPAAPLVSARYLPAAGPVPGQALVCCCPCDDKRPRTPEKPGVSPRDYSGFLIVRVAPGVEPLTVDSLWELAEAAGLDGLRSVLELSLDAEEMPEGPAAEEAGSPRGRSGTQGDATAGGGPAEGPRGPLKRRWRDKWRRQPEERRPPEPGGVLVSRPLIQLGSRDRKSTVWSIRQTEDLASRTSFRPRSSLARYWRVDLRPYSELVDEVLARFNELAEVDLAYRELRALDTAFHQGTATGDALAEDQSYFDRAPVGIGADWVREHLRKVEEPHLKVIDLEQGWHQGHEELAPQLPQDPAELFVHGENRDDDEPGAGNHGTAVLGQLAAAGVGTLGLRGSAATIAGFQLASHYRRRLRRGEEPSLANPFPGTNGHVASAIVNCLIAPEGQPSPLGKGDVLLLEIQRGRLPTEIDEADFDAIRLATALGIIVVEAAGNGNFNLDRCVDPQTGRTLRRGAPGFGDSGAILVGAAFSALPHDRAPFSNYGSRVDCYGWGEGVTTCGYGDLHDGGGVREQFYTNTFNGTSSAAPIIAGAAALLQCLHLIQTTNRLLPVPMRALLSRRSTGTPQGPNAGGHIGVMPDLDAITRGSLQLVPDLYVRRHPADDGSPSGPAEAVSSSPDILVAAEELDAAKATARFGEGAGAHHPAPGAPASPGVTAKRWVHVRLRNRGQGEGSATVLLYESPTATLIPPERWRHLEAGPAAVTIPAGDTLQVSGGVEWSPPAFPVPTPDWPRDAVRTYSFLAVFDRDGEPPPDPIRALPPGPPYFDWRRYREFLRGPGVAWRNVHPVAPGAAASLAFFLAGTTDRAREFDLEVIQRLPQGPSVELHLPQGLTAKLLQRQAGLGDGSGPLTLPRRRSTRFSRVRLPEGLCAPARFQVTAASGQELSEGHSLAIRQLWRGEEVGRITWYVTQGAP